VKLFSERPDRIFDQIQEISHGFYLEDIIVYFRESEVIRSELNTIEFKYTPVPISNSNLVSTISNLLNTLLKQCISELKSANSSVSPT
jgi:hypothetical protein